MSKQLKAASIGYCPDLIEASLIQIPSNSEAIKNIKRLKSMTEQDWLTSEDPKAMLKYLVPDGKVTGISYVNVSDRKLRLYGCALRRQMAFDDWDSKEISSWAYMEEHPEEDVKENNVGPKCILAMEHATLFLSEFLDGPTPKLAASIIREIIDNPFRPARVTGPNNPDGCSRITEEYALYDSAIRPWQTGNMKYNPIMKGSIYYACLEAYENKDFSILPIIADMLEDTDSANLHILNHLRGLEYTFVKEDLGIARSGQFKGAIVSVDMLKWVPSKCKHVRGCWALDLLLGKQ